LAIVLTGLETGSKSHPYVEVLRGNTLIYMGEGLQGDQVLTRGNLALYEHPLQKFPLYAFRRIKVNSYECLGSGRVAGFSDVIARDNLTHYRKAFLFDVRLNDALDESAVLKPRVRPERQGRPIIEGDPFGSPLTLTSSGSWSVRKAPRGLV
jgi:hypothetical protein